jgi:ATP-binding cassette, subfamily B, bacterial
MSPWMGPIPMRSKRSVRRTGKKEDKQGAWELWKALPRAKPYLRPYRKTLILLTLATVLAAIFGLGEPWPLAVILNQVLNQENPGGFIEKIFGEHPERLLLLLSMLFLRFFIVVSGNGFTVLNHFLGSKTEQNMVLDLRSDLFNHVQRLSLTFHDQRQTGALMSQINNQAAAVGTIVMVIPPVAESLMTLIGMLAVTALIDWELAVLSLVVVPLLFWSFGVYGSGSCRGCSGCSSWSGARYRSSTRRCRCCG